MCLRHFCWFKRQTDRPRPKIIEFLKFDWKFSENLKNDHLYKGYEVGQSKIYEQKQVWASVWCCAQKIEKYVWISNIAGCVSLLAANNKSCERLVCVCMCRPSPPVPPTLHIKILSVYTLILCLVKNVNWFCYAPLATSCNLHDGYFTCCFARQSYVCVTFFLYWFSIHRHPLLKKKNKIHLVSWWWM